MPFVRSLAARVVALVAVVAFASALLTGGVLVRAIRETNREQAASILAANAESLADRLANRRRNGCTAGIDASVLRLVRRVAGAVVRCGTPSDGGAGVPTPFSAQDVTGATPDADPVERTVGGTTYLVVARPAGTDRVLLVAQPERDAVRLSAAQRNRALLGATFGLLGGLLGGVALAGTVTRPLRRVADAARRLSAGHRDVRVPPEGPEEVADVARALDGLAGALASSEDRQRQFLLAVSHELRTPLTAVTGYAEALADGVLSPDEVTRAGGVIRDEAARLQGRVADLLALARLEADDFRLDLAPVDAAVVVEAAAAAWRARAQGAGVDLRTEVGVGPLVVRADGERLRQAVDALCDNALRVLPGGAPLILATHDAGGGWVRVQVRDGGPGLAPEDLAVAFERGRLTQRYRGSRPVGSGLGLALVGELARRMGGHPEALTAPEGGVAFGLVLPRA